MTSWVNPVPLDTSRRGSGSMQQPMGLVAGPIGVGERVFFAPQAKRKDRGFRAQLPPWARLACSDRCKVQESRRPEDRRGEVENVIAQHCSQPTAQLIYT
jgi:hypothetical protein